MEAIAKSRFIGTSPRKMRLVIDLVRGKSAPQALAILKFTPNHAARSAAKTLRSAIANLQNRDHEGRIEVADMFVKEVFVDEAPTAKRISPAPMGRAYRIRKRSHHLTVIVSMSKEKATAKKKNIPQSKAEATPAPAAEEKVNS